MTQLNQIYKCEKCGNIVEVVHAGPGELVSDHAELLEHGGGGLHDRRRPYRPDPIPAISG